jgi:hypothetical protein
MRGAIENFPMYPDLVGFEDLDVRLTGLTFQGSTGDESTELEAIFLRVSFIA